MIWKEGDLCVAKSKQFGWRNCEIKQITKEEALVQFLEYEGVEKIKLNDAQLFGPSVVNRKGELVKLDDSASVGHFGGWKVGDSCVAQWVQDEAWYNSRILHIFSETEVLVRFTEYGNADFTSVGELKHAGSPIGEIDGDPQKNRLKNKETITQWNVGDDCVAQWTEDGVWYRSKILMIAGEDVQVLFTEYGNKGVTTLAQLRSPDALDKIEDGSTTSDKQEYATLDQLKPHKSLDTHSMATTKTGVEVKQDKWKVGDLCVALWNEDGVWYNSKILKIDGETVLVEFVEYGNQDYTTLDLLKLPGYIDVKDSDGSTKTLETSVDVRQEKWKVGDLCVALWNEDGVWYNSKVLEIKGEKVLVEFMEYGNQDYTTLDQLKPSGYLDKNSEETLKTLTVISKAKWKMGDLCVAQWKEDGVWYNSNILKIEGEKVLVEFVEYGNQDYTTLGQLKSPGSLDVSNIDSPKKMKVSHVKWKVGDLCVALWDEDGVWYNSKILEIGERVLVEFVEYGNQDYTTLDQLKPPGSLDLDTEELPKTPEVCLDKWNVGDLCIAQWNEDKVWYDSKIMKIEEEKVLVKFLEYGNEDYTTLSQLRPATSPINISLNDSKGVTTERKWKIGAHCVALWNDDGVWYNSKILKIDGEKVLVQFIDYGNEDYTTLSQLKPEGSLNKNVESLSPVEDSKPKGLDWKVGDFCVAKSIKFEQMYNSQIKKINESTALLDYIEFSVKEELPLSSLMRFGPFSLNKDQKLVEDDLSTDININGWKNGDNCVAKWDADNSWYDSKILKIFSADEVLVQFTKYGNADFTKINYLKPAGSSLTNINEEAEKTEKEGLNDKSNLEEKCNSLPESQGTDLKSKNTDENLVTETIKPLKDENLTLEVKCMQKSHIPQQNQQKDNSEECFEKNVLLKKDEFDSVNKSEIRHDNVIHQTDESNAKQWKIGDYCVAKWQEDNTWYNSKILDIQNGQVRVLFTEYGNQDYSPLKLLKPPGSLDHHGNLKPDHSADCSDLDKTGQYSDIEETNSYEVGVGKLDGCEVDTDKQSKHENEKEGDKKIKTNELENSNQSDRNTKEAVNWKEGDLCVAMWVEDSIWYNSKIMEICGDVVLVKFLDYGNEDYTTINQLKPAGSLNDFTEVSGTTEEIHKRVNHETLTHVDMDNEYNKETMAKDILNRWKVGGLCVAQSNQDGLWYNSKILAIQGDKARIQFLENGNEDSSTLEQLKPTSYIYSADLYAESKGRIDRDDLKEKQANNESRFYTVRKIDSGLNKSSNTKETSEVFALEKIEAKKQGKLSYDRPVTAKIKSIYTFPRHSQRKPDQTPPVPSQSECRPAKDNLEINTKVTTHLNRWKAGDKAAAFWETDRRWRHAIIQEVDKDQAFVICPDEVMVKATWVKVTTLKHKSVPIIGLNLMEDGISKIKAEYAEECKSNHETPRIIESQINESKLNQELFSTSTPLKNYNKSSTKSNLNDLAAVIMNQSSPESTNVEVDKGNQSSLENKNVEAISDQSANVTNHCTLETAIDEAGLASQFASESINVGVALASQCTPENANVEDFSPSQCAPENTSAEAVLPSQCAPENINAEAILAGQCALQSINVESILPTQNNPESTNLDAAITIQRLPERTGSSKLATHHSSDDHLTNGRVKPSLCGYTAGTTIADYRGKFLSLAMTETGSRYLQSSIPGMNQMEIQSLQMELMKNAVNAINHPKATYVVQKLMEVANSDSLDVFVDSVSQHFSWLACNPAGCRVVQKSLIMSSPDQQLRITAQLENLKTLLMLLKNKYGIHVMQASLPLLPVRTLKFIVNSLLGYMVDLGRHPYGTFFVQQLVTLDVGHQVGVDLLVEEILQNAHLLSYDKYGTWLVQALISAPQLEVVLCRLSSWAAGNLASIYQNQYAVFMAISLFQRLLSLSLNQPATGHAWSSMVVSFVTSLTDLEVEGRPLLITAATHSVGHLLAREIALQVTKIADFVAKNKVQDIFAKYNIVLKADTFGFLVLKALHGLM